MSIYIYKNNQQAGPFEQNNVLEWLKNGQLSLEDMAFWQGATKWQPLKKLFSTPKPVPAANVTHQKTEETPIYRKTTLQKIIFGGIVAAMFLAFCGALVLMRKLMMPSGDLELDLGLMPYRAVFRNGAFALFIGIIFTLVGFIMTFKQKIIQTYGLRILLRGCFVFLLTIGFIQFGSALVGYTIYSPTSISKNETENSWLKAMRESEADAGKLAIPMFHLPIACGLLILGISGFSMTGTRPSDKP